MLTFSNNKAIIGTTHTNTSSNNLTVEYTKPGDLTKAIKPSNGIELEADPDTGVMPDEYERSATEFSLGYNINDNAKSIKSRF